MTGKQFNVRILILVFCTTVALVIDDAPMSYVAGLAAGVVLGQLMRGDSD